MGALNRLQPHRRELLVVLLMTAIGGMVRIWSPGRLGLVHFDEGIYALAGLWPLNPKGFWGIDPTVIAYAPGGYPFLIGLASFVLGLGDLTPILVSILMGTLTIPLAAWLSWRTFGPTAGAITATLAAFSGFHIAFSRMGLTDVSFLFFFLLALGLGQRFLERPNALNTIGLGVGVGLAQWFKYHGWLAGAIVILTAVVNAIRDPAERQPKRLASVWGQGAFAGLLAFAVFWPWFSFVESNGGYADLLRHHASYMQGTGAWLTNLVTQLDQQLLLRLAGPVPPSLQVLPWIIVLYFLSDDWKVTRTLKERALGLGDLTILIWLLVGMPWIPWWLGLLFVPWMIAWPSPSVALAAVCWLLFTVMTPLYHPYARLWMPLEACGWLIIGWQGSVIVRHVGERSTWRSLVNQPASERWWKLVGWWPIPWAALIVVFSFIWRLPVDLPASVSDSSSSDSLRNACRQLQADLPKDLARLRFLGRPPITFYLATAGVPLAPQPDLDSLLKPGVPSEWALVDDALLRQEPDHAKAKARLTEGWEVVREFPTRLNLPTLLDINPGAARGKIEPADFECPLWLLRPRIEGIR